MKDRIINLIRKIHHSMPPGIRKSYRFVRVMAEKISQYILPVYHCSATDSETGEVLSMVQVGWDKKLMHYWLDRFSDQHGELIRRRWITVQGIPGYLASKKIDSELVIIDSSASTLAKRLPGGFQLPRWMELIMDIESVTRKKKFHNIRRNIRKQSLDYVIRNSSEDFDLFYHHMYTPLVRNRHGAQADVSDYKHFASKFKNENANLFFIILNDEPVAAAYVEDNRDFIRLSAVGVLEGNREIYRLGVIGALYYFVILYYREKGRKSLFLGKSMAVVLDGVAEFKREFGATPYLEDLGNQSKYYLMPMKETDVLTRMMKRNPVFNLQDQQLNIAGLVDVNDFGDKMAFLKHFKRFYAAQVERTTLYCKGDTSQIRMWMQEEGLDHIVVKESTEFFLVHS